MEKRFYRVASWIASSILLYAASALAAPSGYEMTAEISPCGVAGEGCTERVLASPATKRIVPTPPNPLWTDARTQRRRDDTPLAQGRFASIASALSPAIVNIEVELSVNAHHRNAKAIGQGSGFFIHQDGYIVTNAHVVAQAATIHITTSDRRVYTAEIVGLDQETDIALIRVVQDDERTPNPRFPIAKLGDSRTVQPGDWVVAIGNPFGLHHTVTAGIVSAVGRRDMVGALKLRYANFIQIDAAINFGNSGGPLLNMHGDVIGMNTAIQAGNDLGFAIPAQMIREVLPQLAAGEIERAWSGLTLEDLDVEDARSLPNGRRGARVLRVAAGSPAAVAGVKRGDIIIAFDGRDVEDSAQLNWWIAIGSRTQPTRFSLVRDGAQQEVSATLELRPPAKNETIVDVVVAAQDAAGPRVLGVSVGALDAEARERLAAPVDGVLVLSVAPGSPAARAGLQVGDVVTHLGDVAIATPEAFLERGRAAEEERRVAIRAVRGRMQIFLYLQRSR